MAARTTAEVAIGATTLAVLFAPPAHGADAGDLGELDNNIIAAKNKPAWDAALKAAGNRDYTL